MIPGQAKAVLRPFAEAQAQSDHTYGMELSANRVRGYMDGKEAVRQAVFKMLNTERYDFPIYSWNYGVELQDLMGQPIACVTSELVRRITEALTQDERIEGVSAFSFSVKRGAVACRFTVHSIYGDLPMEQEVRL